MIGGDFDRHFPARSGLRVRAPCKHFEAPLEAPFGTQGKRGKQWE